MSTANGCITSIDMTSTCQNFCADANIFQAQQFVDQGRENSVETKVVEPRTYLTRN